MLTLHAHTKVPLSSARTWTPFHHPLLFRRQNLKGENLSGRSWTFEIRLRQKNLVCGSKNISNLFPRAVELKIL